MRASQKSTTISVNDPLMLCAARCANNLQADGQPEIPSKLVIGNRQHDAVSAQIGDLWLVEQRDAASMMYGGCDNMRLRESRSMSL